MIENYHISVVVPCYNESKQILKVLESMPVFVDTVIVVDDCSTDKTIDIVKNFIKAGNERIRLICHSSNWGVGACIHSGYEDAIRSNSDLMASLSELRGEVLGCFCKPQACHGDVLVKLLGESND
jgi:glycosyltransferase involved in cell wall biosynthesis